MADGGGALEQQQGIAARIPYQNIELAQSSTEKALSAWAIASQIKLKRQEIEGKMQALAERNRQLEINTELKDREFAIRMASQEQSGQHQREMAEVAWARLGMNDDAHDLVKQKYIDKIEGDAGISRAQLKVAEQGITPTDPRYWKAINQAILEETGGRGDASSRNAVLRTAGLNVNTNRGQVLRNNELEMDSFRKTFGSEVFGSPGINDTSALEHPEQLPDATKKEPSFLWGNYWPKTVPDPGKKIISGYDTAAGKKIDKTISVKELNDWKKQYEAMKKRHQENVPDAVNDSGLGVTSDDNILPAPADPGQRQQNQVYKTPKGNFRWINNQWQQP